MFSSLPVSRADKWLSFIMRVTNTSPVEICQSAQAKEAGVQNAKDCKDLVLRDGLGNAPRHRSKLRLRPGVGLYITA
jgi:hypothetical protein